MKDAISYIRVSSEEQADSGLGLEAALRKCEVAGMRLLGQMVNPKQTANCTRIIPPPVHPPMLSARLPASSLSGSSCAASIGRALRISWCAE
jgi:hypothetical protein